MGCTQFQPSRLSPLLDNLGVRNGVVREMWAPRDSRRNPREGLRTAEPRVQLAHWVLGI